MQLQYEFMEISSTYDPSQVEDKWYAHWMAQGYFHAEPDPNKASYTVVIPPPNVTGVLHMGHMLNNTIQDVLIRKARMEGKVACWLPGTDHASIATEAKVVRMLRDMGIKKSDLSRDEFLAYAWEWKEKYGGIILEQLKKLGASCDWERTTFTMDPAYHEAVIKVFTDLHRKGYIYRGLRMVNWDPEAQTTVSNEEVIYNEQGEQATLYAIKYELANSTESLVIATLRPETIMGDAAIAVNPKDDRYKHLIGKKAIVPFVSRAIPIVGDDYVDIEFGTGCLKVTPAHDPNDYEIGQRHGLEVIDTIDPDGTLNANCGVPDYEGKDRFEVRKLIVRDLKAAGRLVDASPIITKIGRSERTNAVIEPRLSLQWFIRMKDISKRAHQAVMEDDIQLHPAKFKNTYNHWMENVRDWCISRQLWWGQRIPAYYYGDGAEDYVVAESASAALEAARQASENPDLQMESLRQDEDVLDTWASSWLWPMASFGGFDDHCFDPHTGKIDLEKNETLKFFYPTQTLVTAPEILFFWVARMIIAGYAYTDKKPFEHVYLTGIVRDAQRRKMSKSLGNSPDPLVLIKKYSADGVRTGMLFSSPAGNDLLFDEKLCEQGRNFSNKIWNAFRLVQGWTTEEKSPNEVNQLAMEWFENRYRKAFAEMEDHFQKFRVSDALMAVYKLTWNDFCSAYLEWVKPAYGAQIDVATKQKTILFFERLLKILHPFMPFITEEIWHAIDDKSAGSDLIVSPWPTIQEVDEPTLDLGDELLALATEIRGIRNQKQIPPKEAVDLIMSSKAEKQLNRGLSSLKKLANLENITVDPTPPANATYFLLGDNKYFVPLAEKIDLDAERQKLSEELAYQKGFLMSVNKKLSNEKFIGGAPAAVVEKEKQKQADAQARIQSLEESLTRL